MYLLQFFSTYYSPCLCEFIALNECIHCLPDVFGIIEEYPSGFIEALL